MLNKEELERYNRQIILKDFGEKAQENLINSSALIVGLGGLGSVSSLYLVAAGVGKIGLIDKDIVSLSNLQRQTLFREDEVGKTKVDIAKQTLERLNSGCKISTYNTFLNWDNAKEIMSSYDIIIDATDNFKARYLINDVAIYLNKPFVYGAIQEDCLQVGVFNEDSSSATYRDLFPEEEKLIGKENPSKAVMGVLPSIAASLQANEAIKLLALKKSGLKNRLLSMNINTYDFSILNILPKKENREKSIKTFFQNYN
ncbi:MAG: HesA/MoeB/ThiF family protein [Bacteroidales bacterium]|jgi:adenylyltransferase/sulfurtransferase|nr:HesA/MoeB/ThiF family protein [Bacteroidales bacterium]